jgi:hypothetical protein
MGAWSPATRVNKHLISQKRRKRSPLGAGAPASLQACAPQAEEENAHGDVYRAARTCVKLDAGGGGPLRRRRASRWSRPTAPSSRELTIITRVADAAGRTACDTYLHLQAARRSVEAAQLSFDGTLRRFNVGAATSRLHRNPRERPAPYDPPESRFTMPWRLAGSPGSDAPRCPPKRRMSASVMQLRSVTSRAASASASPMQVITRSSLLSM